LVCVLILGETYRRDITEEAAPEDVAPGTTT
jgi:hypothetical protein